MQGSESENSLSWRQIWKLRRVACRNRLFARKGFQSWASRFPLTRFIARARARQLFDLLAGFTYSQTLLATDESGLLDLLAQGVSGVERIASVTGLSEDAAERLVRAAGGIGIAEEVAPGLWMLGEHGAALVGNSGARAMIRHHRLLYRDLADPLALLADDRRSPTELSEFWRYAANQSAGSEGAEAVDPYSQLMAASQEMVSEQVLEAYRFQGTRRLLDIGGGLAVFASAVKRAHPSLVVAVLDLPGVLENTARRLADLTDREGAPPLDIALHEGDFFHEPLPQGYDTISLVRILHDHDDASAQQLLVAVRQALPAGGRVLVAEPMAKVSGAEAMGETYFGLYLWAMRSGRPRSAQKTKAMLERAGFSQIRQVATRQPVVTSLIVARN